VLPFAFFFIYHRAHLHGQRWQPRGELACTPVATPPTNLTRMYAGGGSRRSLPLARCGPSRRTSPHTSSATAPCDNLAWTVGGGLVFNNTKSNSIVFYLSSGVAKSSSATIDLSSGATKPNFAYCQFQLCGAQSRALDRTTSGCMGDVIVEVVPPPRGCTGAE
jgi:hypothetical protein